ncbi:MAG: MFS transporter, partial [Mycobacterium sp.]
FAFDTTRWWVLAPWFLLAGVGIGCVETAEHAAVATHAAEVIRGSAFGLLAAVQSVGNLAASGIAGLLWATVSPTAAFTYVAAWMIIALITLHQARPVLGNGTPYPNPHGRNARTLRPLPRVR